MVNCKLHFSSLLSYSYRNAYTGFLVAAFQGPSKSPQRGDFWAVHISLSFISLSILF